MVHKVNESIWDPECGGPRHQGNHYPTAQMTVSLLQTRAPALITSPCGSATNSMRVCVPLHAPT